MARGHLTGDIGARYKPLVNGHSRPTLTKPSRAETPSKLYSGRALYPSQCFWAKIWSVAAYWIEKSRCPITLVLTDGRTMTGEIFLNPLSRFRIAPQQPAEFLNQADPFFVLAPSYEERVLIAKASVAILEAPLPSSEDDDHLDTARVGIGIEVELVGGITAAGWIFYKPTEGKRRVQDYLNDLTDQFICLFDSEKTTLVNRHAVAHVRETS